MNAYGWDVNVSTIIYIVLIIVLLRLLFSAFFTVDQQTVSVVERLGKFNRVALAGLNFKIPFLEWIKGTLSLRIQQLDVLIETKTKDNVFVHITVSVQYH